MPLPSPEKLHWHPQASDCATMLDHRTETFGATCAPNGKKVATWSESGVRVLGDTGRLLFTFPTTNLYCHAAWGPKSHRLTYADSETTVVVRSSNTGIVHHRFQHKGGRILRVAYSPNGSWLAMGGDRGLVTLHDFHGYQKSFRIDDETIWGLTFSPDSDNPLLGIRTQGGNCVLWDVKTETECLRLSNLGANGAAVCFSPNGKLFAASDDHQVFIRSIEKDSATAAKTIQCRFCKSIAWSKDGQRLTLGHGSRVQICSITTDKTLHEFRCTPGWIRTLSSSLDSAQIVVVDSKSRVDKWDLSSLEQLKAGTGHHAAKVATMNGRYFDLMEMHTSSHDESRFVSPFEFGYRSDTDHPGFWVYDSPHWYVFANSTIGMHHPPSPLPQPIQVPNGRRRMWLTFPKSICRANFLSAVSEVPESIEAIERAELTYSHKFRFADSPKNVAVAVMSIDVKSDADTKLVLRSLVDAGFSLAKATVLTPAQAIESDLLHSEVRPIFSQEVKEER